MQPDTKQGVTNSSETPSEQTAVDNNIINTSDDIINKQSSSGDVNSTAEKLYTEQEVNEILHKRTKEYSEKLKQYEEMMSKYINNQTQKPVSENDASDLSSEDKAFIEYMKNKILKHLRDEIMPKEYIEFINALRDRELAQTNLFMDNGEKQILEQMEKDNIPKESLDIVKETIASIIMNSKELQNKFVMRDPTVFIQAYNKYISMFDKQIKNKAKEEIKKVVQTKENTTNVKQPVKDGIGVATTEKKKLSDDELIDAAFKRLTGNNS